jgi:hypothetical protein
MGLSYRAKTADNDLWHAGHIGILLVWSRKVYHPLVAAFVLHHSQYSHFPAAIT